MELEGSALPLAGVAHRLVLSVDTGDIRLTAYADGFAVGCDDGLRCHAWVLDQ